MQIHHDGQLNWVCSQVDAEQKVTLYDSLFMEGTSEELDTQLALLYRRERGNFSVNVASIQQQRGGADCGLFSIAVCTALAMGQDPTLLRWRQNKMREHLSKMFRSEIITYFIEYEILHLWFL